jgi:hypothetical protein
MKDATNLRVYAFLELGEKRDSFIVASQREEDQQCQGSCREHRGHVVLCHEQTLTTGGDTKAKPWLHDWGYFAYCEEAQEETKRRGHLLQTHPRLSVGVNPEFLRGKAVGNERIDW